MGCGLWTDGGPFCSKSCEFAVVGWEPWQKQLNPTDVAIAEYKLKKWGY